MLESLVVSAWSKSLIGLKNILSVLTTNDIVVDVKANSNMSICCCPDQFAQHAWSKIDHDCEQVLTVKLRNMEAIDIINSLLIVEGINVVTLFCKRT